MPFWKKKKDKELKSIPPEIILKSKPIKNPLVKSERKNDRIIILEITYPETSPSLFSGFIKKQRKKRIELDEIGSYVWTLIDGNNTVLDIQKKLVEKYKLHPQEARISLMAFLQSLMSRGLIQLIMPKGK